MGEKTPRRVLRREKGSLIPDLAENCSHAPAGRPLNMDSSAQVDRPQTGGYNIFEIALE
jgi:hypothetical protein